jgi:hypothetical protein
MSAKLQTTTTSQSPLLRIPREIRDQIYSHLLLSSALWIRPISPEESDKIRTFYKKDQCHLYPCSKAHCPPGLVPGYHHADPCNLLGPNNSFDTRVSTLVDTSVLRVNHQIHDEALQILFEQNRIYLSLYHGSKAPLLNTPRLAQIFTSARFLKISTYNINLLEPYIPILAAKRDLKTLEIGFRSVHALRWISEDADRTNVAEHLRPFAELTVKGKRRFSWTLFDDEGMDPEKQVLNGVPKVDMTINFAGSFGKVRHSQIE